LLGSRRPQRLVLNLGPGDAPYVSGFLPRYEIEDKVATHWTTYDARIDLPIVLHPGGASVSYRFARVLPETAVVEVSFAGRLVDRFECRDGIFQERRLTVGLADPAAISFSFHVDSHDRKNLGLKMDWLALETDGRTRGSLRGFALARPALLVRLVSGLLRRTGWDRGAATALVLPWTVAGSAGLLLRPWLVHRLLTGVPETLAIFGLIGLLIGRRLLSRGVPVDVVRTAAALAITAFVVRALLVNQPAFYYPDLMTHERLVEVLREVGPRFLLAPSAYLEAHGAWSKPAYGGVSSLPYTPTFHAPFALLPFGYDGTLGAFKLAGAAISVLPLLLLCALARQLGSSAWGALLMLLVPTYTSRLSFALLPALLGHCADMSVLLFLVLYGARLGETKVWACGTALLAAAQLTYVSSVVNLGVFFALWISLLLLSGEEGRRRALRTLAMLLTAAALAVLVFYRDFLGTAWGLASRIASRGHAATTRYAVEGFFALAYTRTRDFFDGAYPLRAIVGGVLLVRRIRPAQAQAALLVLAWASAYFLLLLLRAKIPDVFRYGHETLFVTPLVCLAAGECLSWLWNHGGWRRLSAAVVLAFLIGQGAFEQWRAVAAQLGNAL
jgi:hypothetical protein